MGSGTAGEEAGGGIAEVVIVVAVVRHLLRPDTTGRKTPAYLLNYSSSSSSCN